MREIATVYVYLAATVLLVHWYQC